MKTILVVEDEISIRENIIELLEDDYTVIAAHNGMIGVKKAQEQNLDLVISDVMMPELDGFGMLKILRANEATAATPFIFLTAKADKRDIRTGMELGADDYLTKPFTRDELLGAIDARLKKQDTVHLQQNKKANDVRKNITYALPHELNTSLNGILGPVEILLDTEYSLSEEDRVNLLRMVLNSGMRLKHLTQNFILYTQLVLQPVSEEQLNLMKQQQTVCSNEKVLRIAEIQKKEMERIAVLDCLCETATLKIGEEHLTWILVELISNALKFTKPDSSIIIRSKIKNDRYSITITDQGPGINKIDLSLLDGFMQFQRNIFEQQGMGLGLTIAKKLCELHGGNLNIFSEVGNGTTVTIEFPLC